MENQAASNNDLHQQLRDLHERMDQVLATAAKRRKIMAVVLTIVTLLILVYFWFIYTQIATVDADFVANVAESEIQAMIDDGGDQLATLLLDNRDEWFDLAEQQMLAAPGLASRRLRLEINRQLREATPQLEEQMTTGLSDLIDALYVQAADGNQEMTEAEFQRFLEDVSNEMGASLDNMLAQAHARFREGADPVLGGLEALAEGQGLDTRQQHYRKIVTHVLALLEKHQLEAEQRQQEMAADVNM